jgi:hypothetical protein
VIKTFSFIITILLIFSGCSTTNKAKILLPPTWIGMKKISTKVYVNQDMNATQQKKLLKLIPKAKKYVSDVWGEVTSKPTIYACSTKKCAKSLGIGARAYQINNHIVLSPKAISRELIAHEWSHAELYKKVGGFFNWRKIPSWFDEGLAVFVSHEHRHDERAWKKIVDNNISYPSLNELITLKQWIDATYKYNENINKDDIVVTYAVAGHEIGKWYKQVGKEGLKELIDKIKNGTSFEVAYRKR